MFLLELGHAVQIGSSRFTNSRVLSQDISRWVLGLCTKLVQGDQGAHLPVDIAGNTVGRRMDRQWSAPGKQVCRDDSII